MKIVTKWMAGAALGAAMLSAAPASAQYYGYDYDRYRDRDRVEEVVRGIGTVVGAVAAATQGGYYGNPYGYGGRYGYGRGFEGHAVNACSYEAQRRFDGGRIAVRDVQYAGRNRVRVLGAVDAGGYYGRYDRSGYGNRAFSCDVRADGRVTRFRTHNYAW